MMGKRLSFLIALIAMLLVCPDSYSQQRAQYTQYMFNGLLINPAYAGGDDPLNITLMQRSQWTGVKGAPSTQTLLVNSLFRDKQMGAGLSIVNDRIGIHRNLFALANYAFHITLGVDQYLSMGLQAGVHNTRADYGTLLGDMNDPNLNNPLITVSSFEFGAGIFFRSRKFQIGFSAPALIPEKTKLNDSVTVDLTNTNYFLFAKYQVQVSEAIDVEPGALIKYLPGLKPSFDVNVNVIFQNVLTAGVSYRHKESVDIIAMVQATPQLRVGYAYDHPTGGIRRISNGSHEVMVSYTFRFARSGITSPR
jgi:type IX secretion system PorP/SprF family membrane protein